MDLESISIKDLDVIAQYIYDQQIKIVLKEILEFIKGLASKQPGFSRNPRFVLTGAKRVRI